MLSRSLVDFELRLGKGSKTVLGYTHVVEQLLFSMFPSILTSDFDLISGLFTCFIIICLNIIVKKTQQNGHILVVLPRKEKINSLYLSQSAFIFSVQAEIFLALFASKVLMKNH